MSPWRFFGALLAGAVFLWVLARKARDFDAHGDASPDDLNSKAVEAANALDNFDGRPE